MNPMLVRRTRPISPASTAFDRFLEDWLNTTGQGDASQGACPVDMQETDEKIIVDAEMPGFDKDQIDLSVENGMLNISAEREQNSSEGREHLSERHYYRVDRSVALPTDVDEENIEASLEKGVLHLDMPKSSKESRRRIPVQ